MTPPAPIDPILLLADRFRRAVSRAFPGVDADPLITPSRQPELGDYQSNVAMGLSRRVGLKPRDAALAIVNAADLSPLAEPLTESSIAGPGFINIRLRGAALGALVEEMDAPSLGVTPADPTRTVVVDLCGVNLAKQMHVGHLRSTVIPDAIARCLERLGHTVIRQSHVGDWGLPIAMVTGKLRDLAGEGRVDLASLSLDDLERLYKAAQAECERDTAGLAAARRFGHGPKAIAELEEQVAGATEAFHRARQTLLKLQAHDPEVYAVWRRIYDITMRACLETCARLKAEVTDAATAGESTYADELGPLVEELGAHRIAEESDGALVVRVEGFEVPCLIRKSDGGFLYATTDLAAIRRRVRKLGASRVIYGVDIRQSLHFDLVFGAARRAGYTHLPGGGEASLEHAAFGTILGQDGRPFRTRSGESVKLSDLLDEAVERAGRAVDERSRALAEGERREIAEAVGIAAIKYADLSNDRVKDYVFDFDRMLAFEGNTGPYLLYALVRIRSIFRRAAERSVGEGWEGQRLLVSAPEEKDLCLALLRYPGVLESVERSLEPHRLCQYAFELATAFSGFFDRCPVLQAEDDATRRSRLRLSDLTARVLEDALRVLGIPTVERM